MKGHSFPFVTLDLSFFSSRFYLAFFTFLSVPFQRGALRPVAPLASYINPALIIIRLETYLRLVKTYVVRFHKIVLQIC